MLLTEMTRGRQREYLRKEAMEIGLEEGIEQGISIFILDRSGRKGAQGEISCQAGT